MFKGRGECLLNDCPTISIKFHNTKDLTTWHNKGALKLKGDVVPTRLNPGRSKDGNQCRHYSSTETYVVESLPHILGFCPFRELLRNNRHNSIKTLTADSFGEKSLEVYEKVKKLAKEGPNWRCNILVVNRRKNKHIFLIGL